MLRNMRFVLVALVALGSVPGFSLAAPADVAATPLAGLEAPVKVVRDANGVPHVYARSEHDAYFLVGYLHAQDRLFQMDQSRRQASGTLAELLGPNALPSDAFLRTIGSVGRPRARWAPCRHRRAPCWRRTPPE